jgi:hypothetical protein
MVSMTSSGGVPSNSVMIENWLTSDLKIKSDMNGTLQCNKGEMKNDVRSFPGNSGLPSNISANIHPVLQISTATSYFCQVNMISGAR